MIKYLLFIFVSLGMLTTFSSYADGMIITFEEETADSEIAEVRDERTLQLVAQGTQKSQTKNKKDSPIKPIEQAEPKESDAPVRTYPPTLEKKDFLKNHEEIPTPPSDVYEKTFMQTLLVIIGILLLIFLGVWLIRKFSGGRFRQFNAGKTIKILERRPLSHKSMLYIVDIHGKQFLIAESQLEVSKIGTLERIGAEEKEI